MKIYVVARWHDYEGHEEAAAAFSSLVNAKAYVKAQNPRDQFSITELSLDARIPTKEQWEMAAAKAFLGG